MTNKYRQPDISDKGYGFKSKDYRINETLLSKLGFTKEAVPSGEENCLFRYLNPEKKGNGFDLVFVEEFGLLSVEEFELDTQSDKTYFSNTIVGIFSIESDDDLKFIFSRNVRLNYVFDISLKKTF